jgi:hypothetical protein
MMCDSKLNMVGIVSEDTLTETPRSRLQSVSDGTGTTYDAESPNSSSPPESPSGSKCEDDMLEDDQSGLSDDEDDEEEDGEYHEDDYYAFLRELAGSFEATREDDESEVGSESDGSSDEDEDGQAVGRKRSSAWSTDDTLDNGLTASPSFTGCGLARGAGNSKEESTKANNNLVGKCTPIQPPRGGYPAHISAGTTVARPQQGQSPISNSAAAPPGADAADTSCRRRSGDVPQIASMDHRPPVVDDYDVVKATAEFETQQRLPARGSFERQREDLAEAIRLRKDQAERLLSPARKQHLDPALRSNYARVRSELLAEVRALEEQLEVLDEAISSQQSSLAQTAIFRSRSRSCSFVEATQETSFGGQGVVVQ